MTFSFESKGSWSLTERWLAMLGKGDIFKDLDHQAQMGVRALEQATPKDSGMTAHSWDYTVESSRGYYTITWTNSNTNQGVPIAIILQYGHGTGTGGYVAGEDYINPAMKPVFDEIADNVWKAVTAK